MSETYCWKCLAKNPPENCGKPRCGYSINQWRQFWEMLDEWQTDIVEVKDND